MADEEEQTYTLTMENGETAKTSWGYTGKGNAVYSNGEIYEGDFVDGRRAGKGKYSYANGDKYDGEFQDNKKHGIGRLTYNGKGEYYGFFENGKKHGEGMFKYPNNDIYSGWWRYGKKHGKGTYVFSDTGMRLIGNWSEGKMTDGKWLFPNGVNYEGTFEHNKPKGKGTWAFQNGNTLQGEYIQHVLPADEDADNGDEDQPPKINLRCEWVSETKLQESASKVNNLLDM